MIKTEDFIRPCGCRSVDECLHNVTCEIQALNILIDDAKKAMLIKLSKKYVQGWGGWDDPENLPILKNKLVEHIMKDFSPDNMVDIMNLAAMIRNQLI